MKARPIEHDPSPDLFRSELKSIINLRHELCQLSEHINWERLDVELRSFSHRHKALRRQQLDLHAPEVECISKGKAHKRYAFRVKVSFVTPQAKNFVIGHMKTDHHLGRNYLKGKAGDKLNAIFSGMGYNLRVILKKLRLL